MIVEQKRPDFLDHWDFGDPAASERRFREVLDDLGPDGDRSLRAQLLSQIARTHGLRRDLEAAHETLDEAEAILEGRDLPVARLRCTLERGRTLDSPVHRPKDKRTDEARARYLEVFEDGRRLGLHGLAVDAAHMLGIIEPADEGLAWNLRAIELAEASQDEEARSWLGSLYNNTGWTYHEGGEFERALAIFEKALAWREAQRQPAQARIARWCVGRCLRSLGRLDEALAIQEALLADYEETGETEVGYTSEEVAECLLALGRSDEARPWFDQAHQRLSQHESWLLEVEPQRMARLAELGAATKGSSSD